MLSYKFNVSRSILVSLSIIYLTYMHAWLANTAIFDQ